MDNSKIEWTEATLNPVMGCTPVSEGCTKCYARAMMRRYAGRTGWPADPDTATLFPERLEQLRKWKQPRRVFMVSMGDPFHKDVPEPFIAQMFGAMEAYDWHTYMVLTKRPERMRQFCRGWWGQDVRPPAHIWLGVSAENQQRADERIPLLLDTPAAVRFVSIEPMLGPVDLTTIRDDGWRGNPEWSPGQPMGTMNALRHLDWVIAGGETGPGARSMDLDWVRRIRDDCQAASVPLFIKKLTPRGEHLLDGQEWRQYP